MNNFSKKMFHKDCLYRDIYLLNSEIQVVIISGYFNPLHIGHLDYMEEARTLGTKLVVIVNNDEQVKVKGSVPFMPEDERLRIVSALKYVYGAVLSIDTDRTVCGTLGLLARIMPSCPKVFANGGDSNPKNVPETATCKEHGIEMVFGTGGEKTQSSSWLLNQSRK